MSLNNFFPFFIFNQKYPEVDPAFVEQHHNQLTTTLHVINEDADVDELKLKTCLIFSTISNGWGELIQKHKLPENAEVIFSYYGKSICAIAGYKELHDPLSYPKYHSRSLDPNETFFFGVAVFKYNLEQPKMVNILILIFFC